jgi:hypothetical protein
MVGQTTMPIHMILSSKPVKRLSRLGRMTGSNVELRSRGVVTSRLPKSPVPTVVGVPVIAPVAAFRLRHVGRVPTEIDQE